MADGAMAALSEDMLGAIPADVMSSFNDAADTPDPVTDDNTVDFGADEPADEPVVADAPLVDPGAEEEEEAESEPADVAEPEPAAVKADTEELPDGVTAGKNRKGEEGVFVDKKRWDNTIYQTYKTAREIENVIGEPLTREAIEIRDGAFQAQERMFSDLESGDPATQGKVFDFLLDQMAEAKQLGRVGTDPAPTLANTIYDRLQAKSPEAYAVLRNRAARDLAKEIFQDAARTGDKNLFLSAGHVARWLAQSPDGDPAQIRAIAERMGIPFHLPDEMEGLARGADPLTQLQRENQQLQQQLNGRATSTQADAFQSWTADTGKAVQQGILDEAVKPALASIEEAWKPFKADYDELVVKRLASTVRETLKNDPALNSKIEALNVQARRATNPQFRAQIAGQIKNLYVNRAKQVAEANRRPVIDFANNAIKGRSVSTHDRRQAAQTRTAPQGSTPAVPRSLVPNTALKAQPGEVYDSNKAFKQAMQLLNG